MGAGASPGDPLSGPPGPLGFNVIQVPVGRTLSLRHAVLAAPGAQEPRHLPGDDEPTTVAFAAVDAEDEVLGVVRISLEAPPFPTGAMTAPARRLRGMATRQDWRNRGIGSAVLRSAMAYVASQGGDLVWCNARMPAIGLYRRAGFTTYGEVWVDPLYGPHIVAWTRVGET